jgi:DNA-binding FadR family transcriptional regulator
MTITDDEILDVMLAEGGSFARAIAAAARRADPENRARLQAAFPDLWETYRAAAVRRAPNAHTLTLKFHRLLTEAEWRTVVNATREVPFAKELVSNVVWEATGEPRV